MDQWVVTPGVHGPGCSCRADVALWVETMVGGTDVAIIRGDEENS